jgi:hypothetical protein
MFVGLKVNIFQDKTTSSTGGFGGKNKKNAAHEAQRSFEYVL